ncbi:uncharacterized protein LACBIDRAFT_330413 [Laccaria bicolor S238N-H82]|uniref:Predicted protein n=1 Tax=Laccaria bicolor (strain S238N-H82 / ATCC MYA-4686) TaxID=486041 RepID=B0DL81_LACBS|nr:uncharacterized protein LACBIDRAFT_330413 [Laccaria bicolor S238N-H82]EDR04606.1 predicted protein [Laccaria bicolor S238N-H82]|eukprot:XP_001884778.1 predicted protein [Laccaria bicolor S238N-H82]
MISFVMGTPHFCGHGCTESLEGSPQGNTFLQSILIEHGLDSIPTHSTNKLHKTVYKTVNFPWSTFLWSVSHECGLDSIPTHSTNKLHETVYKTVNLPLSTFLWSILHGCGLNSIPTHSTNMLHKAIYKMVEFPSRGNAFIHQSLEAR